MSISISPAATRKLSQLKPDLLAMPPVDALAFIHSLRARRLRPEKPIKAPRAAAPKKLAKPKKPKDTTNATSTQSQNQNQA